MQSAKYVKITKPIKTKRIKKKINSELIFNLSGNQSTKDERTIGDPTEDPNRRPGTFYKLPPRWGESRNISLHLCLSSAHEFFLLKTRLSKTPGRGNAGEQSQHRSQTDHRAAHVRDLSARLQQSKGAQRNEEKLATKLARIENQVGHSSGIRFDDCCRNWGPRERPAGRRLPFGFRNS